MKLFNFLFARKLEVLMENTIQNNMEWYKDEVRKLMHDNLDEANSQAVFMELHANLIQHIVTDVTNFMKGNPASIFLKYQMALANPSITGWDLHGENMSLAILYCVMYYACTGKKADSVRATKQNHVLHAYTNKVLHELDDEQAG